MMKMAQQITKERVLYLFIEDLMRAKERLEGNFNSEEDYYNMIDKWIDSLENSSKYRDSLRIVVTGVDRDYIPLTVEYVEQGTANGENVVYHTPIMYMSLVYDSTWEKYKLQINYVSGMRYHTLYSDMNDITWYELPTDPKLYTKDFEKYYVKLPRYEEVMDCESTDCATRLRVVEKGEVADFEEKINNSEMEM